MYAVFKHPLARIAAIGLAFGASTSACSIDRSQFEYEPALSQPTDDGETSDGSTTRFPNEEQLASDCRSDLLAIYFTAAADDGTDPEVFFTNPMLRSPMQLTDNEITESKLSLSPDATRLMFVGADTSSTTSLFVVPNNSMDDSVRYQREGSIVFGGSLTNTAMHIASDGALYDVSESGEAELIISDGLEDLFITEVVKTDEQLFAIGRQAGDPEAASYLYELTQDTAVVALTKKTVDPHVLSYDPDSGQLIYLASDTNDLIQKDAVSGVETIIDTPDTLTIQSAQFVIGATNCVIAATERGNLLLLDTSTDSAERIRHINQQFSASNPAAFLYTQSTN